MVKKPAMFKTGAKIVVSNSVNGAWGRIRTTDTRIFSPLLYQLSYPGPPSLAALADRDFAGGRL